MVQYQEYYKNIFIK